MAAKKSQARPQSKAKLRTRKPKPTGSRLLGQVAVVTGASRGIGFAIARALAEEGASIVITGRDAKTLHASAQKLERAIPKALRALPHGGPQVLPEICDVRDPISVAKLFNTVRQRLHKVHILVNNAGVTQPMLTVEETTVDLWREVIETDLTGVFLCTRAAMPLIPRGGTIINNISAAAKQTFPKFATYTAAKHGVLGFTLVLREELIPRGIRVVALMPGATDTEMWDHLWPDAPRERMMGADSIAQAVLCAVLLPASANVSEIVMTPTGGPL